MMKYQPDFEQMVENAKNLKSNFLEKKLPLVVECGLDAGFNS